MPEPLSSDLRQRIVALYKLSGVTYEDVADTLGVGRATVSRILRLHREKGSVEPLPATGGPKRRLAATELRALKRLVDEHADATLEQLTDEWNAAHPERPVAVRTLGRAVHRLGYTRKKSRFERPRWTPSE